MPAILLAVTGESHLTQLQGSSQRDAADEVEVLGWLEFSGRRYPLRVEVRISIGRSGDCNLVLQDPTVSHRHAGAEASGGVLKLWDQESHNGTFVDGEPIGGAGVELRDQATIHFGECEVRFIALAAAPQTRRFAKVRRYPIDRDLTIGRAPDNDVVLDEANVSRHHAVIKARPRLTVEDLGSRNGTRLGPDPVRVSMLAPGDEIGIGHFRLSLDGSGLTVVDQRAGVGLQGVGLAADVKGRTILHPTTLTIPRGEVLALIGPSGSGKSTLLRLLAGVTQPDAGVTLVDGEPVAARLPDLGYVPQQDIIHDRLAVREALTYAAILRLPSDTSRDEIARQVESVATELDLVDCLDTRIGLISGGQRKRAACGVELIGQPSILVMDEPTSGLDPPLERQFMQLVAALAAEGRGVVITTHATSSLSVCDSLAIMAPGGHLAFIGSPDATLEHYSVDHYDELYLAAQPTADHSLGPLEPRRAEQKQSSQRAGDRPLGRQLAALTKRYLQTFTRDKRTLRVLFGQVPIIAVLIAVLFPAGVLGLPDEEPVKSAQFVFLLVTGALWIGLISSCREIVNERSIVTREFAVGVRLDAYIGAKALVLFTLAAIQMAFLLGISTLIQPLHQPVSSYLELYLVLVVTAWAATGMGLAISTLARSVDQATSFVPMLLIPQLLFAGALVTVKSMQPAIRVLSDLVVARWAFAGAGSSIDMNARLAGDKGAAASYGEAFFGLNPIAAIAILIAFAAAGLLAAAALLRWRS